MRLQRRYTCQGQNPVESCQLVTLQDESGAVFTMPAQWDTALCDLFIAQVFCKTPLPSSAVTIEEDGIPEWLWRRQVHDAADESSADVYETDIRFVIQRLTGSWTYQALRQNVLADADQAEIFYDEMQYMLLNRMIMPDFHQWAQIGLDWAYGLPRSQISPACMTIPQYDELDAMARIDVMARVMSLSGAHGAVMMPVENINSPTFVQWKRGIDVDALSLHMGRRILRGVLNNVMESCDRDDILGFNPKDNPVLEKAVRQAQDAGATESSIRTAISMAQQGYETFPLGDEDPAVPQAVTPVLSVSDDFIESALTGHGFMMSVQGVEHRRYAAEKLWDSLAENIWASGAPHVFFKGAAAAGTLCHESEISQNETGAFIFSKDSSAPSAVLDVMTCLDADGALDTKSVSNAVQHAILALDASAMGNARPVVLGITGMASFLAAQGTAYDSEEGRATLAALVAFITGVALQTSAEMASCAGVCSAYGQLEKQAVRKIKDMQAALNGQSHVQKGMMRRPAQILLSSCPDRALASAALSALSDACTKVEKNGLRHLHVTGIDTDVSMRALGINPLSALVAYDDQSSVYARTPKKEVVLGLRRLGYTTAEIEEIVFYMVGHGTLLDAPHINHDVLRKHGFHQQAIDALEKSLRTSAHIRYAFNPWVLGESFCAHVLKINSDTDVLSALGFQEKEIEQANAYCCGAMNIEAAPHIKPEHIPVFDCLLPQGINGKRYVSPVAQLQMQGALSSFVSGGVAHTLALPHEASIDDVQRLVLKGWELGIKSLKVYRDSSSLLHAVPPMIQQDKKTEEDTSFHQIKGVI